MTALLNYLVGAALVAVVAWVFQMNTKVNVIEQKHEDFKESLEKLIDAKFEAVADRLERIERALNGSLRRN